MNCGSSNGVQWLFGLSGLRMDMIGVRDGTPTACGCRTSSADTSDALVNLVTNGSNTSEMVTSHNPIDAESLSSSSSSSEDQS